MQTPPIHRRLSDRLPRGLIAALLLILAWEAVVHGFGIKDYLLPAPSAIAQEIVKRVRGE